jgi:copper chaperone
MTRRETIVVSGMSCGGCEQAVENALQSVDGVRKVDADNETDSVDVVTDGVDEENLESAARDAGYEVEG